MFNCLEKIAIGALALTFMAAGCSSDDGGAATTSSLLVFHTARAVVTVRVDDDVEHSRFRQTVERFYPSVCVDRDGDDDGIPDSLDEHHGRGADDRDGGVEDDHDGEDRDAGVGDDDLHPFEHAHACAACNRGPGGSGDFRFEVRGDEGKLDRGRVVTAAADGTLTVPSPDGAIIITVGAATEVRDGQPAPGAEIRAEGKVTRSGSTVTLAATRLEVLCDAPPAIDDSELPAEAQPVPTVD